MLVEAVVANDDNPSPIDILRVPFPISIQNLVVRLHPNKNLFK
jgi:hypothetical protein